MSAESADQALLDQARLQLLIVLLVHLTYADDGVDEEQTRALLASLLRFRFVVEGGDSHDDDAFAEWLGNVWPAPPVA